MDFAKVENQFKVVGGVRWGEFRVCWRVPSAIWEIWVRADTEIGSEEMEGEALGLFEGIKHAWYFPEAHVSSYFFKILTRKSRIHRRKMALAY